jgi:hypothetical protein
MYGRVSSAMRGRVSGGGSCVSGRMSRRVDRCLCGRVGGSLCRCLSCHRRGVMRGLLHHHLH